MNITDSPQAIGRSAGRYLSGHLQDLIAAAENAVLRDPNSQGAGLTTPVRRAIAAQTARTAGDEALASQLVEGNGDTDRTSAVITALAFAQTLAAGPGHQGHPSREPLDELLRAGLTEQQAVAIGQIIGYTSFLVRLAAVAQALDVHDAAPHPDDDLVEIAEELPHPREQFAMRGWRGWLSLAGDDADFPTKDNQKPNDYYRVLFHDPVSLEHRTVLYDELMRGEGPATLPQREMAALAVSLTTPCSFCASVHGRRHFLTSRDKLSSVQLQHGGPEAVTDPEQRAIARLGEALGQPRVQAPVAEVALMRQRGMHDDEIALVGAVGAMFGWANRLMTSYGEPVD